MGKVDLPTESAVARCSGLNFVTIESAQPKSTFTVIDAVRSGQSRLGYLFAKRLRALVSEVEREHEADIQYNSVTT